MIIKLQTYNNSPVVESLLVADGLGIQHKNLLETIAKYQPEIESSFGQLAFETRPGYNNASIRVAYLNEGQFMFISTLSRNTPQVVEFKAELVKKFQEAKALSLKLTAPLTEEELIGKALLLTHEKLVRTEQRTLLLEAQTQLQEETIKAQAPVVAYANQVLNSESTYPITVIGQDFGLSAVAMNKKLKEAGIIRRVNGVWVINAKYAGQGYTKTKNFPYLDSEGKQQTSLQLVWTQKGREFLHQKLNQADKAA